jgi:acetoin:2,6-dichlorophenolindophenol oxidoreductase subunit alpha
MSAERVDGMNVDAVLAAAASAVERARAGAGPTFLEYLTYRYVGHHTAEQTMKLTYRSDEEIERWRTRDPIATAAAQLDSAIVARIGDEVEALLDDAIAFARASARPDPADAARYVYADGLVPRSGVAG